VSQEQQQARIENQISHLHILFRDITQHNLTWLLVAGHYPIFSRGEHGDMSELIGNLLPLLIQYNVSLYLCGHDHISEHLQSAIPPLLSPFPHCLPEPMASNSSCLVPVP
jgi:3',5'-cyclic AMP phosphodiesterase CpdA